ncbi:MAG: LuxR C-terminal-related transcriptional regulator [Pseudomonadota bacterium]
MNQIAQINLVQTALLRPEGIWEDETAIGTLVDLLGTERLYEVSPTAESNDLAVTSTYLDGSLASGIQQVFSGFDADGFTKFTDPYANLLHRVLRSAGAGAYHDEPLYDRDARENTDVHHLALLPNGIERQMAMSTPLECGEAMLIAGYRAKEIPNQDDEAFALLRLLEPAYTAGRRFRAQVDRFNDQWLSFIDDFSTPVLLVSSDGCIEHRSRKFVELLEAYPHLESLRAPVARLASNWLARTRRTRVMQDGLLMPERLSNGPGFQVKLRAMCCPAPFAEDYCIVEVDMLRLSSPTHAMLTRRESEVANALADGLSDKEIARELEISPHTARRHVENVLRKLDVNNRTKAAALLRRPIAE